MHYGRTLLELFVAQALILAAFLVVPIELVASFGMAGGTMAAALVACALYLRHRGRLSGHAIAASPAGASVHASKPSAQGATA